MIASISGSVEEVLLDGAIIDVGGLGYRVFMPASAIAKLPARGRKVRLHTHLHVREDALTLYGFRSAEERELFEVLITVNGIGPKNGLAILSVHSPIALRRAVVAEDIDALTAIPGIGKKTAARIVLELREKLALPELTVVPGASAGARARLAEVRDALLQLGYSTTETREALQRIGDQDERPTEELLRTALRELAGTKP